MHVLLSEDREERNWEKADDNYKDVQRFILRAEALELYGDVERLIPQHIKPECIEMVMDIEEYVREDLAKKKLEQPPKAKKRARNDDAMRNVPDGAVTGFVSVKDLLQKGKKRKKLPEPKDFEHAAESDDDDREIEAGILGPRRTVSMPAEKPKAKRMKRSTTIAAIEDPDTSKRKGKAKVKKNAGKEPPNIEDLTVSQLERLGQDDSDDEAIALGLTATKSTAAKSSTSAKANGTTKTAVKKRKKAPSPPPRPRTPTPPLKKGGSSRSASIPEPTTPLEWSSSPVRPLAGRSIVDLTRPDLSPVIRTPSPEFEFDVPRWSSPDIAISSVRKPLPSVKSRSPVSSPAPIPDSSASVSSRSITREADESGGAGDANGDTSMAWLLDDDSEPDIEVIGSSPASVRIARDPLKVKFDDSSEVEVIPSSPVPARRSASPPVRQSQSANGKSTENDEEPAPPRRLSPSPNPVPAKPSSKFRPASASSSRTEAKMPPPALPMRFALPSSPSPPPEAVPEPYADSFQEPPSSDGPPPATFAVRGPVRTKKRVRVDSSPPAPSATPARRLHRGTPPPRARSPSASPSSPSASASASRPTSPHAPPAPKRKKRKFADTRALARSNPWLDVEAAHSGSDASDGGSGQDGDAYSDVASSDAAFAGDFPGTQAPRGYDQAAVYRRSLMTQAAPSASVPAFRAGPVRHGRFHAGLVREDAARRPVLLSSSPREPGSEDEYELGTFVVDDDEEISYVQGESILSQ